MRPSHSLTKFLIIFLLLAFAAFVSSQQGATCDTENPCKSGCCNNFGNCGFGDKFCAPSVCVGSCNATAECGTYAAEPGLKCPLNVCCSQYGYCGTTNEFCKTTSDPETSCQSNCGQPERKQCASTWKQRRIAYYESWADTKKCDSFRPEDIPVHALTHINVAFGGINANNKVSIDDTGIVSRVVRLKKRNPALQVFLSLGGWTFSDPGDTRDRWTNMAATADSRKTFVENVAWVLETYGLDGIDLDWEYPRADDRGGRKEDYDNYVLLLRNLRRHFDKTHPDWGLSIAIPASYWYLQHFDINEMQSYVSWFNLMSYDIHGKWDQTNPYTGPYVLGHTNITEIQMGLDLLRRNDVDLAKVNLGTGFYGRTFTLADTSCNTPGCVFSDAGVAGECSGEPGILTFKEIMARSNRLNDKSITYNEEHGVTYMVYDESQWITYDDEKSFAKKRDLLDHNCLGGVMIWAIDQDTEDFKALSTLLGDEFVTGALLEGGSLSEHEKKALAEELGGLTGDGCYVTMSCAGENSEQNKFNTCRNGDIAIEKLHSPGGNPANAYGSSNLLHEVESCAKGQYKTVCCSAKSPAVNCKWQGAPERSSIYCSGGLEQETCGKGRYELTTDRFISHLGGSSCASGLRSLCCDAVEDLQRCSWTECQDSSKLSCPQGGYLTFRGNKEGGAPCSKGQAQAFCCPIAGIYSDCEWKPTVTKADIPKPGETGMTMIYASTMQQCMDTGCPSDKITIAKATMPELWAPLPAPCAAYNPGIQHRYCCDPLRDSNLPFDLEKIFPKPNGGDVLYGYKDDYGNNDKDPNSADETDIGDDPYGFVVLDGEEKALQSRFAHDYEFVHEDDGMGKKLVKRETLTREDPNLMQWTFEHEESTHLVYCREEREGRCDKVFIDNATDTIISLPRHIGSGPFARIVSMEPVEDSHLPAYHLNKRSLRRHTSRVYKLTFDYDFAAIKRADATVNIRVDYTNLIPYWDEMTGTDSPKGSKRSVHDKRWWGSYVDWLKKMNTVKKSDAGKLPMSLHKRMLLYRKRASCARGNVAVKAGLDVILDAKFDMNARWAYYAQGTIVPLNIDQIYTYFEMEPVAEAVLEIAGNAEMEYRMKERIKIIDTLSYPGLAIKGIAAIGPTLDVYGEMRAKATIAGQLRAGAKITFPKYEQYFPQISEADAYQTFPEVASNKEEGSKGTEFTPVLDAAVQASVGVDLLITPEVNLGIKVSHKSIKGNLLNAQIVGFINNTFRFEISGNTKADIGDGFGAINYDIFIKYIYNFGIGGIAAFKWLGTYSIKPLQLFSGEGKTKMLYEHHGQVSLGKRNPFLADHYEQIDDKFVPIWNSSYILDDDWSGNHGALNKIARRDELQDQSVLDKKSTGFFDCNDGGKCASGGCSGDTCEWKPPPKKPSKARRADDNDDPKDVDPVTPCVNSIPAFFYNCKYFPNDSKAGETFDGICANILKYFAANGGGSGPLQATYAISGSANDGVRRAAACGRLSSSTYNTRDSSGRIVQKTATWQQRCIDESNDFAARNGLKTGPPGNKNHFSCDEFPFNSMEEGGTLTISRTCVSGYQQQVQSTLNGLPRQIQQEVTWTKEDGTTKTAFKDWTIDWGSQPVTGEGRRVNRDTAWNYGRINQKSFTFHLMNSDSTTSETGGTYNVFNYKLKDGGDTKDIVQVVGAMNLMDNPKFKTKSTWNAYCFKNAAGHNHDLWGPYVSISSCKVIFDNGAASQKLRRGEQPTPQEMFNITRVEDFDEERAIVIPINLVS